MKTINSRIILIVLSLILLQGCYTSRKFHYELTKETKEIIKKTYSEGRVSCNQYTCLQIDNEFTESNRYIITGSYPFGLFTFKLIAKGKRENSTFKVKVRASRILKRQKDFEILFLDELTNVLYYNNIDTSLKVMKAQFKDIKIENKK
jgi:hypothetical protein